MAPIRKCVSLSVSKPLALPTSPQRKNTKIQEKQTKKNMLVIKSWVILTREWRQKLVVRTWSLYSFNLAFYLSLSIPFGELPIQVTQLWTCLSSLAIRANSRHFLFTCLRQDRSTNLPPVPRVWMPGASRCGWEFTILSLPERLKLQQATWPRAICLQRTSFSGFLSREHEERKANQHFWTVLDLFVSNSTRF